MFKLKKDGLRILFVSTEAAPFAKVGGLGSANYSLPRALKDEGHDARVFIPKYLSVDEEKYDLVMLQKGLKVPTDNEEGAGAEHFVCNVKRYDGNKDTSGPVTTYFLENQEYYEQRANIYGYADDAVRWALLSRGALEFLRQGSEEWVPDIIVGTDWATGFLPNYLRTSYKDDPVLSKLISVFTIHNLAHHGMFDHRFVQEMDMDDGHSWIPGFNNPRLLKIDGMRRGIMHSDLITTVSLKYATEIMTKEYGAGLDDLLRERRGIVHGILNGIDYEQWNPATDSYIDKKFSLSSLGKRTENKEALQNRFGLPVDKEAFILGIVSRLIGQKGFDLLYPIGEKLLEELNLQLIVVGDGDGEMMKFFYDLEEKFPKQVAAHLKFDSILPHTVFAGADSILIPSRYEPCGLIQMEAMRMGAVPIVRETGGLADTVTNFDPDTGVGTGFSFKDFDPMSLMIAIIRAVENYNHKSIWRKIQQQAMSRDLSWESSAKKYVDLFERALDLHQIEDK